MIVTDRSKDALDPDKIPLETIQKHKWINRIEYLDDDCAGLGNGSPSEVVAFLKACGAESEIEKVVDTLDPHSGVRPSLDQFMWATSNPQHIDPETDPNETALHSLKRSRISCRSTEPCSHELRSPPRQISTVGARLKTKALGSEIRQIGSL